MNKLNAVGVLIMLSICIMSFASASDYSQMESVSENILSDSSLNLGIIAPDVHINTYQVTVNYIGASSTTEAISKDIGAIVGMYWGIVNADPEVGDLLITIEDINGDPIGKMTCQNDWVSGLDIKDMSSNQRVALKVLLTAKTVQ